MLKSILLGKRLIKIILIGMCSLLVLDALSSYIHSKNLIRDNVLSRLQSIAVTSAMQLDGDLHRDIVEEFSGNPDSLKAFQSQAYQALERKLTEIKHKNELNTEVYTLFLENKGAESKLFFGVVSDKKWYFKHAYSSHPEELLKNFEVGAKLHEYKDSHGTWLSAFAPILDTKGNVVAVIQVDRNINDFIGDVWMHVLQNLLFAFLIVGIVTWVILSIIKKLILIEGQKVRIIEETSRKLQDKTNSVTNSINYAKRIQDAIISTDKEINTWYPDSFILNAPKDIVSGDFTWFKKTDEYYYIGVFDCTGHGVPGAMVSLVGHRILNDILFKRPEIETCLILQTLHKGINRTFNTSKRQDTLQDGMDGALCRLTIDGKELQFSGAHRPLFLVRNNELLIYKSVRRAIGGNQFDESNREFSHLTIALEPKDRVFMFSDGYPDQFGGEDDSKFGIKAFKELLLQNVEMSEIERNLNQQFILWKGETLQTDDVLVLGIEIP